MRHRTPLVVALALIVGGLAAAPTAMGHTADQTSSRQYEITDQGVLTGYGGPAVNPLGGHVENPATGETVLVPYADAGANTGPNGEHQHLGNGVAYSIHVNGTSAEGDDISRIVAVVEYTQEDPTPFPEPDAPSADLDMYLYGPDGDIVEQGGVKMADTGPDGGFLGFQPSDLPEGSYTVLLVARYGVAPYDTTVTVTD